MEREGEEKREREKRLPPLLEMSLNSNTVQGFSRNFLKKGKIDRKACSSIGLLIVYMFNVHILYMEYTNSEGLGGDRETPLLAL